MGYLCGLKQRININEWWVVVLTHKSLPWCCGRCLYEGSWSISAVTWVSTDLQMRHQGLHPCLPSHQISGFLPLNIWLSSQLHTAFIFVPFLYPFSLPFSKALTLILEFILALELNVLFSNLVSAKSREARNSLCLFLDLANLAIFQCSSQAF